MQLTMQAYLILQYTYPAANAGMPPQIAHASTRAALRAANFLSNAKRIGGSFLNASHYG
jgi:hypothetical protein